MVECIIVHDNILSCMDLYGIIHEYMRGVIRPSMIIYDSYSNKIFIHTFIHKRTCSYTFTYEFVWKHTNIYEFIY